MARRMRGTLLLTYIMSATRLKDSTRARLTYACATQRMVRAPFRERVAARGGV